MLKKILYMHFQICRKYQSGKIALLTENSIITTMPESPGATVSATTNIPTMQQNTTTTTNNNNSSVHSPHSPAGDLDSVAETFPLLELDSTPIIPDWPPVMTFEPTMEEFRDLTTLIRRMEAAGAHRAGIAKIRPPEEWVARRQGYRPSEIDIEIQAPVQQTLAPTNIEGAFQATHKPFPKLRVEAFR
jgi:hypothetical protein